MRRKPSRLAILLLTVLPFSPFAGCSTLRINDEYEMEMRAFNNISYSFNSEISAIMERYDFNKDKILSTDEIRHFIKDVDAALKLYYKINSKKETEDKPQYQ